MMSSENTSKKIVQSLIDLVNMAKWLMDENQQPSVTQELGRPFPSIRGRGFRLITCFMSFLKFDLPRL